MPQLCDKERFDRIFANHKPMEKVRKSRSTGKRNLALPCPRVVSDTVDAFQSMGDGLYYDSKSAYYKSLDRKGLRVVEEGKPDAPVIEDKPAVTAEDVKATFEQSVSELGGGAL